MKKRILSMMLCVAMVLMMLVGCGGKETPAASDGDTKTDDKKSGLKVGFAQKNLDNPFQNALAEGLKKAAEAEGWKFTVLSADNDIEKELQNVETFISGGFDLIFLNVVDNEAGVTAAETAMSADIPVIEVDSIINDPKAVVTTVYSPNFGNGQAVGEYLTKDYKGERIKAAIICGNKGNDGGKDRSEGEITGIIKGRTGWDDKKSKEAAEKMYQELVSKGSAVCEDADFEIVAQGWGGWTEDGGLPATEDILVAHKDINCLIGEQDAMLIGGMQAVEDAGLADKVRVYAAADAQKEALKLIKEGNKMYQATGLNDPDIVGQTAMAVAKKILIDGAAVDSFEETVCPAPVCVSKDNVDKYYDPDSIF